MFGAGTRRVWFGSSLVSDGRSRDLDNCGSL
jgi:hypothetical protein